MICTGTISFTALIKQALVTMFPSGSLPYKKGLDEERSF